MFFVMITWPSIVVIAMFGLFLLHLIVIILLVLCVFIVFFLFIFVIIIPISVITVLRFDLLLSSFFECLSLLELQLVKHVYDLLDYLEEVGLHARGHHLTVEGRCQPQNVRLTLILVRESRCELRIQQLLEEVRQKVVLLQEG
jgi:hypothetical protein